MGWLIRGAIIVAVLAVVSVYLLRLANSPCKCASEASLHGRTVIVTGANAGLGKATVLGLGRRGARVIMACRNMERCGKARGEVLDVLGGERADDLVMMPLDLSSLASVRQFAAQFLELNLELHVLVNNAGTMFVDYRETSDGFESTFGVNYLGHFLLTNLLLPRLKESTPSRIVTISDHCFWYAETYPDGWTLKKENYGYGLGAYCNSKLHNVMMTAGLVERLAGSGVTAYSNFPGAALTEGKDLPAWIMKTFALFKPLFLTPEEGAETQVCLAVDPDLDEQSDIYWSYCEPRAVSDTVKNKTEVDRLWRDSERYVGLRSQ